MTGRLQLITTHELPGVSTTEWSTEELHLFRKRFFVRPRCCVGIPQLLRVSAEEKFLHQNSREKFLLQFHVNVARIPVRNRQVQGVLLRRDASCGRFAGGAPASSAHLVPS